MSEDRTFVGFGFGAIQAGLFLYEAFRSGRFRRLVVAEVMPDVVDAVRREGAFVVNVATRDGIEAHRVGGVEILNPRVTADRAALVDAVAAAEEAATALPSVSFYGQGAPDDVAGILAAGLRRRAARPDAARAILYAAENHNHAAEILDGVVRRALGPDAAGAAAGWRCLDTVIGKMSGVVTDRSQIEAQRLATLAPGLSRAFLVEDFNRILISRVPWPDFRRGIAVFEEKDDLLPFEEAKLYGHNATHALIGYLLRLRGCEFMSDAAPDRALMARARRAFLEESGAALCRQYAGLDPLFTPEGFRAYVDELLERMMRPHLRDRVDRVTRDPRRKLGWQDRLVGTLRLALGQGIEPRGFALGAAAALRALAGEERRPAGELLAGLWAEEAGTEAEREEIRRLMRNAEPGLADWA